MPRVRRRGHHERLTLTRAQREQLLYGTPILNAWPQELFQTEDEMRLAWNAYKPELLAEWGELQKDGRVEPDRECYGRARFDHGMTDAQFWQACEERYQQRHAAYERKQAEAAEQRKRAREERNAERTETIQ